MKYFFVFLVSVVSSLLYMGFALAQTPHIPASATLPLVTPNPAYPSNIQTVKTVCASGCNYTETGNGNGLAQAIADATSNRATWGSSGAIEIRVDPAITIVRGGPLTVDSCGGANTEIIIRTNSNSMPSQGTRISSSHFPHMPVISSTGNNVRVFEIAGFHSGSSAVSCNIRLMGLYMKKASGSSGGTLVMIGDGGGNSPQDTPGEAPYGIWIDRSFVGCDDPGQSCTKGVTYHARGGGMVDSICTGIKDTSGDSNCFGSWNSPGPFLVENNELSSAGESILIGGAPLPANANYNPTDLTFRRNFIHMHPTCPGSWGCKNLLELKTGVRVLIEGNILQYSRQDAQNGQAMNIKSSNSGNSNFFAKTEHVTVRYNIARDLDGEFMGTQAWNGIFNSDTFTNHITVHDNLCDGCSNGIQVLNPGFGLFGSKLCTGVGCPINQVDQQIKSVFWNHNTIIASSRSHVSFQGGPSNDVDVPNVLTRCIGDYALHNTIWPLAREGSTGTNSVFSRCKFSGVRSDASWASHDHDSGHKNLLLNAGSGATQAPFPLDTKLFGQYAAGRAGDQCSQFASCSVGNIGTGLNNYRLSASSPGKNAATDGRDVGANIDLVEQMTAGAISGVWSGSPPPPPPSGSTCTNPSPVPSGFAAPCPVLSISASSVNRTSGSLTITATPPTGQTSYIYTTIYISNNGVWVPHALSGSSPYPGYSTSQATLTLSGAPLSTLTLGLHYIAQWDWTWNGLCYTGPGTSACNQGSWRVQTFNVN